MQKFTTPLFFMLFYVGGFSLCLLLTVALFQIDALGTLLDVYFYRGLLYILVAALLSALILYLISSYCLKSGLEVSKAHTYCVSLCALFGLWSFFTVGPVILDRSFSVLMLSWMSDSPRPLSQQDMRDLFEQVYLDRYGMFERRIHEQTVSGNIALIAGSNPPVYALTERGKTFVSTARVVAGIFKSGTLYVNPDISELNTPPPFRS